MWQPVARDRANAERFFPQPCGAVKGEGMINLTRMTAEYVDHEDRIALIGDGGSDGIVRLWLVRPLIAKLVPALTDVVKPRHDDPGYVKVIDTFRQAAAEQQHTPQPPVNYVSTKAPQVQSAPIGAPPRDVRAEAAMRLVVKDSNEWLVREMKVRVLETGFALLFVAEDERTVSCGFSEDLLRQWLGILRKVCLKAGWVSPDWPEWMQENQPVAEVSGAAH